MDPARSQDLSGSQHEARTHVLRVRALARVLVLILELVPVLVLIPVLVLVLIPRLLLRRARGGGAGAGGVRVDAGGGRPGGVAGLQPPLRPLSPVLCPFIAPFARSVPPKPVESPAACSPDTLDQVPPFQIG